MLDLQLFFHDLSARDYTVALETLIELDVMRGVILMCAGS